VAFTTAERQTRRIWCHRSCIYLSSSTHENGELVRVGLGVCDLLEIRIFSVVGLALNKGSRVRRLVEKFVSRAFVVTRALL
jgi:hypothetical protein